MRIISLNAILHPIAAKIIITGHIATKQTGSILKHIIIFSILYL
jgi:hypothetical protein